MPAWRDIKSRMAVRAGDVFGIDLRSLAAFRIATAGIILCDLWYRGQEIAAFYTDQGILPRAARIALIDAGDQFGYRHQWSLHMLSGEYWTQLLLMLAAAWFACWLLIGYRTRLAAALSWILLLSLDARNPAILNSGDVLLRSMLLWSLFLPLGAAASVDRLLCRPARPLSRRVVAAASVALLLQLGIMYFFSALAKTHPVWHTEMTAVYYALNCDAFVTPLGIALREYPTLMKMLTAGSYWLELLGPFVVLLPFATARLRLVMVAVFWLFHLGLGLTLTIGLFPAICMAAWLVYLPGGFWDWLGRRLAGTAIERRVVRGAIAIRRRWRAGRRWPLGRPQRPAWRPRGLGPAIVNVAVAALLVYVVLWNVREQDVAQREKTVLPRRANGVARALGLDQNWAMFSPIPRTKDGWLVMRGTLRDGSQVNLWQPQRPVPWDKPRLVSAIYRGQRWRKYLDNLTTDFYLPYREYFCDWLGRRWNRQQARDDRQKEVVAIELIHRVELTPPPGQPMPEPESEWLYRYYPIYYE